MRPPNNSMEPTRQLRPRLIQEYPSAGRAAHLEAVRRPSRSSRSPAATPIRPVLTEFSQRHNAADSDIDSH